MTQEKKRQLTERFRTSGEVLVDETVVCFASGKTIQRIHAFQSLTYKHLKLTSYLSLLIHKAMEIWKSR